MAAAWRQYETASHRGAMKVRLFVRRLHLRAGVATQQTLLVCFCVMPGPFIALYVYWCGPSLIHSLTLSLTHAPFVYFLHFATEIPGHVYGWVHAGVRANGAVNRVQGASAPHPADGRVLRQYLVYHH